MNVRLVLERKRKRIWTAQMREPESTIGRAIGCTIRIPSSAVSRLHCRLRIEHGVVTVEDLGSINGTFLNGARVRAIETVRPGDHLMVGPATFLIEYELSREVLERLRGEEEASILEETEEVEVVMEDLARPATPPPTERLEEVQAVEEVEEVEEVFVDDGTELNLPEGGDLREFLLELDDTEEH
jgi:pSer/pThr/pTyr-binding forkhead associated (FHA) protein